MITTMTAAGSAVKRTPVVITNLMNDLLPVTSAGNTVSSKRAQEARLAGEALVETDFANHVRREGLGWTAGDGPGSYAICLDKVQQWLVTSLRGDSALAARERVDVGLADC